MEAVETTNTGASDAAEEFDPIYSLHIQAVFEVQSLNKYVVYEKLIELYGGLVVHLVSRYNKVTANSRSRDIVQELFLQLKQAKAIEKFLNQSHAITMPETITGELAHQALGVSWELFCEAVELFCECKEEFKQEWMATPVQGTWDQKKATYRTNEIILLAEQEFFGESTELDIGCLVPRATKRHFQNYLSRIIHNRFVNYCRGEKRHNQERVWDTFADQRSLTEEPIAWENRLPDKTPGNQEARAEISLLVKKLSETPLANRVDELFEYLGDGHNLEEAIARMKLNPYELRRTHRVLRPWIEMSAGKRPRSEPPVVQALAS